MAPNGLNGLPQRTVQTPWRARLDLGAGHHQPSGGHCAKPAVAIDLAPKCACFMEQRAWVRDPGQRATYPDELSPSRATLSSQSHGGLPTVA